MITLLVLLTWAIVVMYVVSHIFVTKLLNGEVTGTYTGFIGRYILRTFRHKDLYHRGEGLPVTLTDKPTIDIEEGTVIFLGPSISTEEQDRCSIDYFQWEVEGYWWTKEIYKNPESNDFGRFNSDDELWVVPFWYVRTKFLAIIAISFMLLNPTVSSASDYTPELIKLHQRLSKFPYDFHAMTSAGGYREAHAKKHFTGPNKPVPVWTGEGPYGRRNSAAIVDILTNPEDWQTCNASTIDSYGIKISKTGFYNDSTKHFLVFSGMAHPVRKHGAGGLISSYVTKLGARKIKCNWNDKRSKEVRKLRAHFRTLVPQDVGLTESARGKVIVLTIAAGIVVTAKSLGEVLAILLAGALAP